jgi:hypothetical protein
VITIDAHGQVIGGRGEGKCRASPQANFKTLINKNAIKSKIGVAPCHLVFFPESLDHPHPQGILAKT